MARDRNEIIKEAREIQRELNKLTKENTALNNEQIKRQEELVEKQKELRLELKKSIQDRLDLFKAEESSLSSISSMYEPLIESQRESLSIASQMNNLSDDQITAVNEIQRINRDIASLSIEDVQSRIALTNEYRDQLGVLQETLHGNTKLIQTLKQQNSLANDYANMTRDEKSALDLQNQAAEKLKQTFQGISETVQTTVMRLFSVKGALGGVIFAAGELVGRIGKVNQELGTTLTQTDGVGRRAGVLSFIFEDAAGTAKNLSSELGSTERATFGLQTNVGLMAMNMGISNAEAATLVGSFTRLNGNSTDIASDMVATSREFARQNGIIPSQLMADLANSAEEFALFGKQGGKNILEASGYAARLGVNMKAISGVAENLLDFESSITKELELGAMLGRNINLNKARELAFQGDIEGATKEAVKQLGGYNAFVAMDPIMRKQTADLLGVSVAELQKMVANEKEAATMGGMIRSRFDEIGESVTGFSNTLLGKGAKGIGSFLMMASQAGAQFKMMGLRIPLLEKGLSKIPGVSRATEMPQTPSTPSGGGKGISSITDSISKIKPSQILAGAAALVIVAGAVFVFGKAVQEFMQVSWSDVGKAVVSMVALIGSVAALGAIMSSGVGTVAILAGAASMLVVAGAVFVLGKSLQEIGKGFEVIGSVGTQITELASNAMNIGILTTSLLGLSTVFPILASSMATFSIAAALGGGKVTSFIQGIAEGASLLAGGAAQGLQTTAQAMISMGSGLSMINDQLDRLNPEKLDALSNFSMSLSIGGAVNAIGESIGGLVDSVSAVIGGGEGEGDSLSQYETDALRYLERIAAATEKGATIKGRDRSGFNPMGISNS